MTTEATRSSESTRRRPPGPQGLPIFGNYLDIATGANPIEVLSRAHAEYGDVARFRFGPFEYWFIQDLGAIHHVLVENAKNYVKSRSYEGLKLVLGNGLVTSEGDLWKRQRKLISPAFTPRRIEHFVPTFVRCTRDMLAQWDSRIARDGELRLDAHAAMMELTFRIVGLTLFSTELGVAGDQLGPLIEMLNHFANDYSNAVVRIPTWVPLPRNRAFQAAMRDLDALVHRIVDERRRSGDLGTDLLGVLMAARDDESGVMTDAQLRDEMLTLLSAGHETTANALAWTLVLLSRHPEVEARLVEEVRRVVGDRMIEAGDLPALEYTERVIQESMRVYPPVWGIERQNVAADVLCGYPLAPNTMIGIAPWLLHRDARYWPDPERFDPDRFLPEVVKTRPRLSYLPFGGGPRVCVGAGFAMLEAKAILATMMQSPHRVRLAETARIALDPAITLRPKYGIAARVHSAALSAG